MIKNFNIFEKYNEDIDPYGEEIWEEDLMKIIGKTFYYVHFRNRDIPYIDEYYCLNHTGDYKYFSFTKINNHVTVEVILYEKDINVINEEEDITNVNVYLIPIDKKDLFLKVLENVQERWKIVKTNELETLKHNLDIEMKRVNDYKIEDLLKFRKINL